MGKAPDGYGRPMTNTGTEETGGDTGSGTAGETSGTGGTGQGISDDQLPEDLQPSDDNPLAKPLTEDDDPKSAEELDMMGGKVPEESGEEDADASDDSDDSAD